MILVLLLAGCPPTVDTDATADRFAIAVEVPPGLAGNERVGAFQMLVAEDGTPYVTGQVAQIRMGAGSGVFKIPALEDSAIGPIPGGAYGAMYLLAAWDDVDNDRFHGPYEPILTTSATVLVYPTDVSTSTFLPFVADQWQAFAVVSPTEGRLVPVTDPFVLDRLRDTGASLGGTTDASIASLTNARISSLSAVELTAPTLPDRPFDQSASPSWTINVRAAPAPSRTVFVDGLPGVAIDAELPVVFLDLDQNGLDLNDAILGATCLDDAAVWLLWLDTPRTPDVAAMYTLNGLRTGWQTVTRVGDVGLPIPVAAPAGLTFGACAWN